MESVVPPWAQYGLILVFVVSLAYALWGATRPSREKALAKAEPIFKTYPKVTRLAPLGCPQPSTYRLCDYYAASSSYSVFPGSEIYDYISDSILPLVIKAGPRMVELDIYADEDKKPVVGLKNQKLGTDYAFNTVPFQACCISIANNAFNSIVSPVSSDPFILSLVFHTNISTTINACAEILKTTCRPYLFDYNFGYQRRNLAIEPVCNLQNKIIIVSGKEVQGTMMEEMVNLSWATANLRRLTYTQASQTYDSEELIEFNRNNVTMVVPDAGTDLVNYNPEILFTYGCQWNMMSYGSPDTMMELYIGHFQENSFVIKPEALRAKKPPQLKTPTMPDPVVSFQPMQQISPIYNITV
jgi:hypothetical protein